MLSFSPSYVRQNLFKLIKQVNVESRPIEIVSKRNDEAAVLISKKDWDAIQETLYLQSAGVLNRIKENEKEDVENLDDID
ncbi:type II toxin-antitoxin system Phd/YefM family antitoxin [Oceanobacillus sp. CAU 1775]